MPPPSRQSGAGWVRGRLWSMRAPIWLLQGRLRKIRRTRPAAIQTTRQTYKHTFSHAIKQASKQVGRQAGKQANRFVCLVWFDMSRIMFLWTVCVAVDCRYVQSCAHVCWVVWFRFPRARLHNRCTCLQGQLRNMAIARRFETNICTWCFRS